jgi:ATP-dependent DNA helicase RecQ
VASERNVAAYIIFSDASLQEMARSRPTSLETFALVSGVGSRRLLDFGTQFSSAIAAYCQEHGLTTNQAVEREARSQTRRREPARGRKLEAFEMFAAKTNLADVAQRCGLAQSTISGYIVDYILQERPASVSAWVDDHAYGRVTAAAAELGDALLKPIYERLDGQVGYDQIKIVLAHRRGCGT